MNKRKILMLAMSLCMVAILAVGGTLAYFTDTDEKTNVFTVGKVDITLNEVFDEENAKLMPATGSAQDGTLVNGVQKEVYVANNQGSEPAYVRVHIAIPSILDNGNPSFDAGKNVLHFNYDKDSIGEGKWDWSTTVGAPYVGNWNYYEINEGGIDYNVYVVTYGTALAENTQTPESAMSQVYLDRRVTSADMKRIDEALNGNWQILVKAEGAQAAGFENAYDALNTAFGTPSAAANPWNNYGK